VQLTAGAGRHKVEGWAIGTGWDGCRESPRQDGGKNTGSTDVVSEHGKADDSASEVKM
jgi:hypothetical protein